MKHVMMMMWVLGIHDTQLCNDNDDDDDDIDDDDNDNGDDDDDDDDDDDCDFREKKEVDLVNATMT